ncbi:hypothetical protein LPJ53_005983, partial [Coemansia erecta]
CDPVPVLPDAEQGAERAGGVRAGDGGVLQRARARGDRGQGCAQGGAGVRGADAGGAAVQRAPAGGRDARDQAQRQGVRAAARGAEAAQRGVREDVCGGRRDGV